MALNNIWAILLDMTTENDIFDYEYNHYNDYAFKSILLNRANGLLKFAEIPYKIKRMMISEVTNLGPSISRLDFVGEAEKEGNSISLILECQTKLPTDEDIKRFFQYVSSIRIFKDSNVELFILCVEKPTYTKKEFVIKEDCVYTMHVISLKDFKAKDIFKKLENKLKNNQEITDEDIASLQLIVYTDFEESKLEILNKARKLFEDISDRLQLNINEKTAIIYLFDVLSANMLDSSQYDEYVEENKMLLNPVERYMKEKGIEEGVVKGKLEAARRMLDKGFSLDVVVDVTGLSRDVILDQL